jgi:hydroxymethylpyrimidine/phosphomethylpyrimidine kinase
LQADLNTFLALGVHGATVVTAVTAQDSERMLGIHPIPAQTIAAQLEAVFSGLSVDAVKTGMLGTAEAVVTVAAALERVSRDIPVIVDPVIAATNGARLLSPDAEALLARRLIPRATLVTPNLHEAAVLTGGEPAPNEDSMKAQAERLVERGARAVLVKGGHLPGPDAVDIFFDGKSFRRFATPRLAVRNTRGTGCTLASAIAAFMAKGSELDEAVSKAKRYLQAALQEADERDFGTGAGPLHHFCHWEGAP